MLFSVLQSFLGHTCEVEKEAVDVVGRKGLFVAKRVVTFSGLLLSFVGQQLSHVLIKTNYLRTDGHLAVCKRDDNQNFLSLLIRTTAVVDLSDGGLPKGSL